MKVDKNLILYIVGLGIMLFIFMFFITTSWIGYSVKKHCKEYQIYSDDCVLGAMEALRDESLQYNKRNSAVWTLGQLGDKRALPILQNFYEGSVRESREKLDEAISQYEVEKAIKLIEGGFNLGAFVWR